jgi:hypothetical protein
MERQILYALRLGDRGYFARSQPKQLEWSFTNDITEAYLYKRPSTVNNKANEILSFLNYRHLKPEIVEVEVSMKIIQTVPWTAPSMKTPSVSDSPEADLDKSREKLMDIFNKRNK